MLQGDGGFSKKSEREQASYYYSQPFFSVSGRLMLDDKPVDVTGLAWMDREWSSQPLASDQNGWDWFALHFDGGEKLMLYRMRQSDGRHYTSGKLIASDGKALPLATDEVRMMPKDIDRDGGPQGSDVLACCDPAPQPCHRLYAAQSEELDGYELRVLGGPDQLCWQPPRRRLSRADRILELATFSHERACRRDHRPLPAARH